MPYKTPLLIPAFALLLLSACDPQAQQKTTPKAPPPVVIERTGYLDADELNEASGLQASFSHAGDFFVHNDDGPTVLYAIDETGNDLGVVSIDPARNKDWEDITSVPVGDGRWLVAGDIGDNFARRKYISLYFAEEPQPDKDGRYDSQQMLKHRLDLTYPDGPRDCESMAYDPVGERILLLSKRDKPARLYAIGLQTALQESQAELTFLGTIHKLRPPSAADKASWGGQLDWISQPTGMDISADGTEAVVITYRSLYRFQRRGDEDWFSAMQRQPTEVVGPPGPQNEAVAYSSDGKSVFVTTEKRPSPVFRFEFRRVE